MIFKRCKHKWVKQSEVILPAPVQTAERMNAEGRAALNLFLKTHVVILSCEKCGKIYKSVEKG